MVLSFRGFEGSAFELAIWGLKAVVDCEADEAVPRFNV